MKRWGARLFAGGLLVAVLGLGRLTATPRSVVDWRRLRVLALESDDWGLAGFVPAAGAWDGLDRQALMPGRFPAVYWESTLEDAATVDRLAGVLAAHRGRDGLPAVLQPNYVMASLAWDETAAAWRTTTLPDWPPAYARPGLWRAVTEARRAGVWHPELHAHLHYDPERRREAAFSTPLAAEATRRGIMLFPASEKARELAPWRPAAVMAAELDSSLAIFGRAFGRRPGSVIAPDYHWHDAVEDLWQSRGLRTIQAKREHRVPGMGAGRAGRVRKYVSRQWARIARPGRTYLERNCRLEPVQSDDVAAVVAACVADTRRAWARGEPAIVETHRVNYAHTDPAVVATGAAALAEYLDAISAADPGPWFLCDDEIAQLSRRGTSWRRFSDRLVLRNGSRSVRVVAVPVDVPDGSGDGSGTGSVRFYRVGPGETRVVAWPGTDTRR